MGNNGTRKVNGTRRGGGPSRHPGQGWGANRDYSPRRIDPGRPGGPNKGCSTDVILVVLFILAALVVVL